MSLTRRQRQKAKKRLMKYCERAIAIIQEREESKIPLENSFGYKDPTSLEACLNIQRDINKPANH